MIYASVCSGIGGAEVAFEGFGWTCAFMSEIEVFPRAVLMHRFPSIPLYGDFREIDYTGPTLDLLVGGPPCQDFSIAGQRAGMEGERGSLTLAYVELVAKLRPRWIVYENVPGLLSSNGGRDFGAFIGALGKCGYSFAWRSYDAQYFGVPQRRRRVYLVGHLGAEWQYPAAVLFDPDCLSRHPAKGVEAREDQGIALCVTSRFGSGRNDPTAETYIAYAPELSPVLRAEGFDASEDGTGRVARDCVATTWGVRRLTPLECERLQAFPDEWTLVPVRTMKNGRVKMAADGPRYKALGNAFATCVVREIGARIAIVDALGMEASGGAA